VDRPPTPIVCYPAWRDLGRPDEARPALLAFRIGRTQDEPPDIDVDFEHERREEVIQYIYSIAMAATGPAIAATVIHYRPRSAIRDVGKALGLTEDVTARLADTNGAAGATGVPVERHDPSGGARPDNPTIERTVGFAIRTIESFPRHLSQHVGGFVLAEGRLDEMVPIGKAAMADRTFIEWDKDDIDALG
jgi:error-prone DNA polymerase